MNKSSFDRSRWLDITIRINAWQSKTFVFLENGSSVGVDITGHQYELFLKKSAGDRKKIISLTNSNGLSFVPYVTNELFATFTAVQSNLEEGQYYWELRRRDIDRPQVNGWANLTYGPQDSES